MWRLGEVGFDAKVSDSRPEEQERLERAQGAIVDDFVRRVNEKTREALKKDAEEEEKPQ